MNYRYLWLIAGFVALASIAMAQAPQDSAAAKAKAAKQAWTPPRTADGHPDLQGFWANNNATPLERPPELAGRPLLTDEEVAALRKKAAELFGGQGDAAFGDTIYRTVLANVKGTKVGFKSTDGETGDYSSEWNDKREWENRTSLITDPPDGRLPEMTPEAKARRQASQAAMKRSAGPQDRPLQERCLTYGSPQLMAGYQSYYQIVETPASVVVMTEMIHDARSIPLNGGPHLPSSVHQWFGDSRGHWDGDTLVVDTTNYKMRSFMSVSSEQLHVTERFTRTDPETLEYAITIDDPGTWTKPWSLMIPLKRSAQPVFEYACHEGNYGMAGVLAGARAEERAAGASASPK